MDWNKVGAIANIGCFVLALVVLLLQYRAPKTGQPVRPTRIRTIAILLVVGFLLSGANAYYIWKFPPYYWKGYEVSLEKISDRTFMNETVELDGKSYTYCKFRQVTFVYNGTAPVEFANNEIYGGFNVKTGNESVLMAWVLARGLGAFNAPLLGPDLQPLPHVEPPIYAPGERPKQQ